MTAGARRVNRVGLIMFVLSSGAAVRCGGESYDLAFSTFLGGSDDDNGRAGCVGTDGSLIVAGTTSGHDWPTKNAYQDKLKGPGDAVIARSSAKSPTTQ